MKSTSLRARPGHEATASWRRTAFQVLDRTQGAYQAAATRAAVGTMTKRKQSRSRGLHRRRQCLPSPCRRHGARRPRTAGMQDHGSGGNQPPRVHLHHRSVHVGAGLPAHLARWWTTEDRAGGDGVSRCRGLADPLSSGTARGPDRTGFQVLGWYRNCTVRW